MNIKEGEKLYREYFYEHSKSLDGTERRDLDEDMEVYLYSNGSHWKENLLVDHREGIAYYLTDGLRWRHFTQDDIDRDSLEGLDERAMDNAEALLTNYPYHIGKFKNGVAEVEWQLIPDGMYFMDSDGYGMTDDVETTLYAMVDRHLQVLVKFRYINKDYDQLKEMRTEAESKVIEIEPGYDVDFFPMDEKTMQEDVYGPPPPMYGPPRPKPIDDQSTIYGPPPIRKRKGCGAGILTAIIAAVAALIFFFTGKNTNKKPFGVLGSDTIENPDSIHPTVYGPPSLDDMDDDWPDGNNIQRSENN